jgi:hypothetical protein
MSFKVEAKNPKHAQHKAESQVSRMEGGPTCLEVTLVKEIK